MFRCFEVLFVSNFAALIPWHYTSDSVESVQKLQFIDIPTKGVPKKVLHGEAPPRKSNPLPFMALQLCTLFHS